MKTNLRLALAIITIAFFSVKGNAAEKFAEAIPPNSIEKVLKDFESIKPGMTRAEVEKKFPMDGGIQGVSPVRFTHPACAYFKIDVEFDFKRNAADQGRAIVATDDKVTKISKPYIERPFSN